MKFDRRANGYIVGEHMYFVVKCENSDLSSCIDMMAMHKFEGEKVICINGRVKIEQLRKALGLHIEIFDRNTMYEIMENIRQLDNGINIPAIGYGAFKMHVINTIKNKRQYED